MERLTVLILVGFVFLSGCRMCGTDYDYCMPAIVDGNVQNAGPLYRAGSILNDISGNYDGYFTDPDCVDCKSERSVEFIEYSDTETDQSANSTGSTGSKNSRTLQDDWGSSKGWQGTDGETEIGIPKFAPPDNNNNGNNKQKTDQNFEPTSLEELMKITPPRPTKSPKNINPPNSEPPQNNFTLENLKKLDPSVNDPDVQEVKIIKIEDTTLRRR